MYGITLQSPTIISRPYFSFSNSCFGYYFPSCMQSYHAYHKCNCKNQQYLGVWGLAPMCNLSFLKMWWWIVKVSQCAHLIFLLCTYMQSIGCEVFLSKKIKRFQFLFTQPIVPHLESMCNPGLEIHVESYKKQATREPPKMESMWESHMNNTQSTHEFHIFLCSQVSSVGRALDW